MIFFINKKVRVLKATFLKSEHVGFGTAYTKNVDWQSPQCSPVIPALPISSSEARVTEWRRAPSVGVTTQLLRKQANEYSILN